MRKKLESSLKMVWNWFKKRSWYIILLCASSIYVFFYRYEIYQLKELNARNLIFLLWLILLLLPLFSEMEFLGVKIKKVVENANKEIKEEVKELGKQVTELKVTNSIANHIQISNSSLPSEGKLEELLELVRNIQQEAGKKAEENINELPQDKSVYLLKVRQGIEKLVFELVEKAGYITKAPLTLSRCIWWLGKTELLDRRTVDVLIEIVRIANRGVHNEIISDEYIEFVQTAYPEIEVLLKSCLDNVQYQRGNYCDE